MKNLPTESKLAKNAIRIYVAGPFAEPHHKETLLHMIDLIRKGMDDIETPCDIYIPMEYKVKGDFQKPDGTWNLPNHVWAKDVFWADIDGIDRADAVVALYDGRKGTTGTAWEIGYAYGKGIPVVGYIPEYAKKEPMSLMVMNCFSGFLQEDSLCERVLEVLPQYEQK